MFTPANFILLAPRAVYHSLHSCYQCGEAFLTVTNLKKHKRRQQIEETLVNNAHDIIRL